MTTTAETPTGTGLKKTVGFWGLMFVSLGSIIGSGWLLGALNAASFAGAASIISWLAGPVIASSPTSCPNELQRGTTA